MRECQARLVNTALVIDLDWHLGIHETRLLPLFELVMQVLLGFGIAQRIKTALADKLVCNHAYPRILERQQSREGYLNDFFLMQITIHFSETAQHCLMQLEVDNDAFIGLTACGMQQFEINKA